MPVDPLNYEKIRGSVGSTAYRFDIEPIQEKYRREWLELYLRQSSEESALRSAELAEVKAVLDKLAARSTLTPERS